VNCTVNLFEWKIRHMSVGEHKATSIWYASQLPQHEYGEESNAGIASVHLVTRVVCDMQASCHEVNMTASLQQVAADDTNWVASS
jgi:hypothetical protein